VYPGQLSYFVYHGKNRSWDSARLCNNDIVITTFSIVAQEWKSKHDPLHDINFYRVVLDEAHEIRTEKTQRSRSVCAITSERRWAVTGTPIQNSLADVATLFKFLKYKPLDTKAGFHDHILAAGDKAGMDNLRSALKVVCLRRTKDVIEAQLPSRKEHIYLLDFRDDERELYNVHKQDLIRSRTYSTPGRSGSVADTLRCLSKLRMICDHGQDLLMEQGSGIYGSCSISASPCIMCNQNLSGSVQFEGFGCPHRSICAECIEMIPETGGKLFECEQCSGSEATAPATPATTPISPATPATPLGRFPFYKGPSTKVTALLQAIRSEFTGDGRSPKQ
jgi:SWI/SNF-related matrix-associated actin-dependent regulator of chromatin subfamily A3